MTLYDELIHAVPLHEIDHYKSDLYVKKTYISTEIIKKYKQSHKLTTSVFSDVVNHELWYEVPFLYDPWWVNKGMVPKEEVKKDEK